MEGARDPNAATEMKICGLDLSVLPRKLQFVVCAGGVFCVYQLHALSQEYLFRAVDKWNQSWFMTFFCFAVGFVISSGERYKSGDGVRTFTAPVGWYLVLGGLLLASMGFSNLALTYINLPTQVVFKSAKVIPVMIAGYFVQGKTYGWLEYLSAVLFFAGLSLFTLADVTVTPDFNWSGVVSLGAALCADAFIGNAQEKLLKERRVPLTELVQGSYMFGTLLCFILCVANGELVSALRLCAAVPHIWGLLLSAGLAGYLGTYFVLMLVNGFGAVTAVVVTSCRKLITILLSFVLFPKPFTLLYLWATLILFAGVFVNSAAKHPQDVHHALLKLLGRGPQGHASKGSPSPREEALTRRPKADPASGHRQAGAPAAEV